MSDSKASEALASWLTKQEAADKLQASIRSIERRIAAGEIETKKRRKSGPKQLFETVVNPRDIERSLPSAHVMPMGEQAPTAGGGHPESAAAAVSSTNFYEFLQALLATVATGATASRQLPEAEKNWLTVEEAAARSGLSEALLKQLCKAGKLPAIRDGRVWKIHRRHLDEFTGE